MNAPVPILESTEDLLPTGPEFSQAVLDAIEAPVAILNADGTILGVNRAWKQFVLDYGAGALRPVGVGANYLEIARQATGPNSDEALAAYGGIRRVLEGTTSEFTLDHACNSPTTRRWFQLRATPLHVARSGLAV